MKKFLIIPLTFCFLALPALAQHGASGDPYTTYDPSGNIITCGESGDNCTYQALFQTIDNVIDFVILYLLVPLSVIAILRAGIMLVLQGENPGQHKKALDSMKNVIIGMVLVFGAFVIIKTFVVSLSGDSSIGTALRDFFN